MKKNEMINNRVALITGASRGIGKAVAIELARRGFRIAAHYNHNDKAADDMLHCLEGSGHFLIKSDFSHSHGAAALFDEAINRVGRIDVLVSNAGIYIEKSHLLMGIGEFRDIWDRTIQVNLTSAAMLAFLASNHMAENGGGRIIHITSRGAFRGEPNALAYGASKAGLNSFSQSLARAMAPSNVFVFTIAPGFVDTDMARQALEGPQGAEIKSQSPLNRAATPVEIANLVGYLAAEAPEYLTGSIIDMNGASYLRN